MNKGLFTSKTDEWSTPCEFFDELHREFHLEVDVCADASNHKLPYYWDIDDDGLSRDWSGKRCWMNPPYGKSISKWIQKASEGGAEIVVSLLPARTDTRWFWDYIYQKPNVEIRFVKGRIKFGGGKQSAPFPSMVVIFRG